MSSSSSPTWQLCRLRRDTVSRLKEFARGLVAAYERGQLTTGPSSDKYSVDQIVDILLNRATDHRTRSSRPRARKAKPAQDQAKGTDGVNT